MIQILAFITLAVLIAILAYEFANGRDPFNDL